MSNIYIFPHKVSDIEMDDTILDDNQLVQEVEKHQTLNTFGKNLITRLSLNNSEDGAKAAGTSSTIENEKKTSTDLIKKMTQLWSVVVKCTRPVMANYFLLSESFLPGITNL